MKDIQKPELLAPAGDWPQLHAALKAGADAVYFGTDMLNMRAKAKNFGIDDLPEIVKICKEYGADAHLTLNSIVYEEEIKELDTIIPAAKKAGVTLVICWDHSVIQKCVEHEMPFCVSTQASVSNSAAAKFYKNLGAVRVVPARELALPQIKELVDNSGIEVETFVHGAMCVAISGRCFMSHEAFGKSANRGECIQPCRREYKIYDDSGDSEFYIGEDYIMSPKDLCAIGFIDLLIETGIRSFKIEGRKRAPEYISKVVGAYRKAIDLYFEGKLDYDKKQELLAELKKVYNRGFSSGFYFDKPGQEEFAVKYGSLAETKKVYVGKVLNYFKKAGIAHISLPAGEIKKGDELYIIGNTTGLEEIKVESLFVDDKPADIAPQRGEATFPVPGEVRPNDKVYKVVKVDILAANNKVEEK